MLFCQNEDAKWFSSTNFMPFYRQDYGERSYWFSSIGPLFSLARAYRVTFPEQPDQWDQIGNASRDSPDRILLDRDGRVN